MHGTGGSSRQRGQGRVWHHLERPGLAVKAAYGVAWRCLAMSGSLGIAWRVRARQSLAGRSRPGMGGLGLLGSDGTAAVER